ncbi:MAG TPA: hypothetical protein VMV46_08955 [Thermoanaerobaculia bacterium]|nr:hypothetical protein [Thermoanaerobaculia bacterium]
MFDSTVSPRVARAPRPSRRVVRRLLSIALLGALALGSPLLAAEVKVGGLQVVGPGFGKDGSELTAFNTFNPGTKLFLVLDAGAPGQVVEILEDDCSLESMTDDTGKSLLEGVDWGSFPDVSEDKRYGSIEVSTNGRPAAGATKIMLAGTLVYQTSEGSDVHEIKAFPLTSGSEIKWKTGEAKVGEVAESEWSEGIELSLETTRAIYEQIKEIRFYDASGAQLENSGGGYMIMGNEATLSFSLEKKVDTVALEIETWKGLKAASVPFELTVGLGF